MIPPSVQNRSLIRVVLGLSLFSFTGSAMAEKPDKAPGRSKPQHTQSQGQPRRPHLPQPVGDADFYDQGSLSQEKVYLGNLLFYDKEISGNRSISCATCHHGFTGTSDGLSLPIGEGARGLSVTRDTGTGPNAVHERVPRNAPAVFNLGAKEFDKMFHDGRVHLDASQPSGFRSPAGANLPLGLDNVLAVQAMFPVTSAAEMAGQAGENPIANAAMAGNLAGPGGVWEQLALRLQAIPEYVELFKAAFDDVNAAGDISFVHAANAMAAFEAVQWRADNSPFDRYLRGEKDAMSGAALSGMKLFYGAAKCATCHSGAFQTDQEFHAIAMPQIGPGKGDGPSHREDFGLGRETHDPGDRFKFRTPTLRNTALTGPWGHAGAYNSLEAAVRHHLDPVASLTNYDRAHAVLPSRPDLDALDFLVQDDPALIAAIAEANELKPLKLSDREVKSIIEYLHSLTDPASLDLRVDVPRSVPSGLPIFE